MKLALFADIHSNLEAITACLDHATALGAERFAFLGDLVGYGADPVAVLDLIQNYAGDGAVVVLGNHDAAAIGRDTDALNSNAQTAITWTQGQLGDKQRAFLSSLPLVVRDDDVLLRLTYHVLESDKPAAALIDYTTMNDAELMLIGAPRPGGEPRLFGGICAQVVAEAPCSVTVVRPQAGV